MATYDWVFLRRERELPSLERGSGRRLATVCRRALSGLTRRGGFHFQVTWPTSDCLEFPLPIRLTTCFTDSGKW
jgi:hypothetical protein